MRRRLHITGIGRTELRALFCRTGHIGHILVLIHVAALHVPLLEIEGILTRVQVVFRIEKGTAHDGFLDTGPGTIVASALGGIPDAPLDGGHIAGGIGTDIKVVVIAALSGNGTTGTAALLLQNHGRQHIGADTGLLCRFHDDFRITGFASAAVGADASSGHGIVRTVVHSTAGAAGTDDRAIRSAAFCCGFRRSSTFRADASGTTEIDDAVAAGRRGGCRNGA